MLQSVSVLVQPISYSARMIQKGTNQPGRVQEESFARHLKIRNRSCFGPSNVMCRQPFMALRSGRLLMDCSCRAACFVSEISRLFFQMGLLYSMSCVSLSLHRCHSPNSVGTYGSTTYCDTMVAKLCRGSSPWDIRWTCSLGGLLAIFPFSSQSDAR